MSHSLRRTVVVLAVSAAGLVPSARPAAQPAAAPITIERLMAAPFPTDLKAAPAGGGIAWVASASGVHNVWTAAPPDYRARAVTSYTGDEGLWITDVQWTSDGRTLVYVRGDGANRQGESPNPAQLQERPEQAVFAVPVAGGTPRRLEPGAGPVPSTRGQRVAWVSRGQIWSVDLASADAKAEPLVTARGSASALAWSPDGSMLAFSSNRGTHAFIGVFTVESRSLRYLDASLDRDGNPVWSPDGRRLAWMRQAAAPRAPLFSPRRTADEPWSLRVADIASGAAREVWKADSGYGSAFQGVVAESQLFWGSGDRLVFPWEKEGWLHLYSVPVSGGAATLLTPGAFEVEYVTLAPDRSRIVYNSNQDDIDRRRVWSVPVDGSAQPAAITREGITWQPVVTSDGSTIAALHSDARTPPSLVVIGADGASRALTGTLPADFPSAALVEPQAVTVTATDGMPIHAQLFLPRNLAPNDKRPGLIFFHGGSRRQMLLGWHYNYYYRNAYAMNQWLASQGYVVLSVNYRSGIGYGLEFREALNYGATGGAEFNDVMGAGLYLRSRPDVDPARIGLWGGSYGGYLTAMGLSRASDLFAAGVDLHGVHDWNQGIRTFVPDYNVLDDPDFSRRAFAASPLASVDTWRSPVLLIHGDDDRNVSFVESINLLVALRKRGVEVEQLVFPDEVHDFLRHENWVRAYRAAADFFNRRLGGRQTDSSRGGR
ncbi:MAG: prolyl oligopeptidase family serine peptidase [Acidobacteriota bacterium]|nr:prolyl oligopeptidase family serine peptidase [Acidobacteriota bacterium]